jgi:hypothetical protein
MLFEKTIKNGSETEREAEESALSLRILFLFWGDNVFSEP